MKRTGRFVHGFEHVAGNGEVGIVIAAVDAEDRNAEPVLPRRQSHTVLRARAHRGETDDIDPGSVLACRLAMELHAEGAFERLAGCGVVYLRHGRDIEAAAMLGFRRLVTLPHIDLASATGNGVVHDEASEGVGMHAETVPVGGIARHQKNTCGFERRGAQEDNRRFRRPAFAAAAIDPADAGHAALAIPVHAIDDGARGQRQASGFGRHRDPVQRRCVAAENGMQVGQPVLKRRDHRGLFGPRRKHGMDETVRRQPGAVVAASQAQLFFDGFV